MSMPQKEAAILEIFQEGTYCPFFRFVELEKTADKQKGVNPASIKE